MDVRTIPFPAGVSAPEGLEAVRATTTGRGYLWEPTGSGRALAHQDGTTVPDASSMRLLLGVRVDDSGVELTRRSRGTLGIALNLGPLGESTVRREFAAVSAAVEGALQEISRGTRESR